MRICHVCGFGCEDNAELCPICGAELLERENEDTENGVETDEPTEVVIDAPELAESIDDPVVAEIFCDLLKENGILFTSDESDLSGSMHMGFGGFYTEINVYVAKEDLEKAKELFETIDLDNIDFAENDEDFEGFSEEN